MEDIRNVVLIIAGILASIKTGLDIYDRITKTSNDENQ